MTEKQKTVQDIILDAVSIGATFGRIIRDAKEKHPHDDDMREKYIKTEIVKAMQKEKANG